MAATKKAATKAKATPRKASPEKKSATPKKKATVKAAPAVPAKTTTETKLKAKTKKVTVTAKVETPAAPKAAPKKTTAKKTSTLLRLSDKQKDFLKKILEAGDAGYEAIKTELKAIEGLTTKKLVKKSSKGKAPARFVLTKAALKIMTPAPAPSVSPASAEMPSASV